MDMRVELVDLLMTRHGWKASNAAVRVDALSDRAARRAHRMATRLRVLGDKAADPGRRDPGTDRVSSQDGLAS